jgi:Zn-dependent M28 family amino/carboxypeptidase
MKRVLLFFLLAIQLQSLDAQVNDSVAISLEDVKNTLGFLAADSLEGRGNETAGLQRAAWFIEKEFTRDSLAFFGNMTTFLQSFLISPIQQKDSSTKDSTGHYISPKILYNVVGVLPGRTLPNEAIVFSAHYDHLGTASDGDDAIYNGANDAASGTTALLLLARYFAQKHDNARTLVFCAFAGEELGLLGSDLFVKNINYKNFVAGINIEMIGIPQKGKNAFFITSSQLSNIGKIIRKNLKGTPFKLVAEPDESKNLFQRSDNYSFARHGIPAHSFMTSDDSDPCYHQPCDEVKRIDFAHMKNIIEAIIIGTRTLVDGKDTPRRLPRS